MNPKKNNFPIDKSSKAAIASLQALCRIFSYLTSGAYLSDYDEMEKRGGDAMFSTGAVGRSFNQMGNYYGQRRFRSGGARFG